MKCEEMYWAKCIYVKISKTVGRLFTENKKKCVSFWLLKKKLIKKKLSWKLLKGSCITILNNLKTHEMKWNFVFLKLLKLLSLAYI